MSILNHPLATVVLVIGSVQLLRLVDLTNPKNILVLRGGYIASQMFMLAFWTWMRSVVKRSKKGIETLEYEEPSKPFSQEEPRKVKISVAEYDSLEVGKQMQQVIIGTLIMLALHLWLGMVQPLFLQIILPWKSIMTHPLVLIHLLRMTATGGLKRPFKQPNPLAELMGGQTAEPASESVGDKDSDKESEGEKVVKVVKSASSEDSKGASPEKSKVVSRKKGSSSGRKED